MTKKYIPKAIFMISSNPNTAIPDSTEKNTTERTTNCQ